MNNRQITWAGIIFFATVSVISFVVIGLYLLWFFTGFGFDDTNVRTERRKLLISTAEEVFIQLNALLNNIIKTISGFVKAIQNARALFP